MDVWVRRWRGGAGRTTWLAVGLIVLTVPLALGQKDHANGGKDNSTTWSAGGAVTSLAVSADGQRIVAAVSPSTLKVWDFRGKELLSIRVAGFLSTVAISPDGKRLAGGGSSGELWVWQADGKELRSIHAHSNAIRSVAFSPDGKLLASGSQDRTAKLRDAQTGKTLRELPHPHYVLSVAFDPSGKRLATGGQDNVARVWDAQTGKELLVLKNLNAEVARVTFSPDGERLATGCGQMIRVWDAATGKEGTSIKGGPGWSWCATFSPDGKWLAAGGDDGSVGVWDSRSGKEMFMLRGHTRAVRALAFTPDGKGIVSGGQDQSVRPWDVSRPGELIARNRPGENRSEVLRITSEIRDRSPRDTGFGGNHAVRVPVTFTKGKTYQIDMDGISLGLLRLEDPSGKHIISDRSSAGFSRPRIIHQAQMTGRYQIVCTSWHLRPETGRFTLIVRETTSDPRELARPIELSLVGGRAAVEAELEPRGPQYRNNPCKFLTIKLEAGVTYRVQMSSREFLSYVFVEDPDGKVVGENHIRSGDARPASVTFKAAKAGTYRLIAAQYDFRTGGPQFSLSVEEVK